MSSGSKFWVAPIALFCSHSGEGCVLEMSVRKSHHAVLTIAIRLPKEQRKRRCNNTARSARPGAGRKGQKGKKSGMTTESHGEIRSSLEVVGSRGISTFIADRNRSRRGASPQTGPHCAAARQKCQRQGRHRNRHQPGRTGSSGKQPLLFDWQVTPNGPPWLSRAALTPEIA